MKSIKNVICLLLADLIWGVAFVAQRTGGDALGAYSFNCIRFLLGAVVLLPLIVGMDYLKKRGGVERNINRKRTWLGGLVCGIALFFASNLQQVGITLGATVGKAGFLTACYIILVPILGIFLKKKCSFMVGIGVILALIGLFLLCVKEGELNFALADTLLLLCALAFAIQILAIDFFAPGLDPVRLSFVEFLVCGLLSGIPMFFVDMNHSMEGLMAWTTGFSKDAWIALLYAGIGSSGIAYTLQIVGQKDFHPTISSLIMSLESVFSVLAGWVLLSERLTGREVVGCIVIFAAVILAQVPVGNLKVSGEKK